jgi:hypothetical protein
METKANVQPSFGVKPPLSPLLFSFNLNDVDSLAEGVQGAITGIPNTVKKKRKKTPLVVMTQPAV